MEWLIVLLLCIVVLWFALRVAGDVLCFAIDLFVLTVYGLTLLIGRMTAGVLAG